MRKTSILEMSENIRKKQYRNIHFFAVYNKLKVNINTLVKGMRSTYNYSLSNHNYSLTAKLILTAVMQWFENDERSAV